MFRNLTWAGSLVLLLICVHLTFAQESHSQGSHKLGFATYAGFDQFLTIGETTSLDATLAPGNSGRWLIVSAPAAASPTFDNIASPTPNFDPGFDAPGVYELEWIERNADGVVAKDRVVLRFEDALIVPQSFRITSATSLGKGQAFTQAGVYLSEDSMIRNDQLYFYSLDENSSNSYSDLEVGFLETFEFGDFILFFGARMSFNYSMYIVDTINQTINTLFSTDQNPPYIEQSDQYFIWQSGSSTLRILDLEGQFRTFTHDDAFRGFLADDIYYFSAFSFASPNVNKIQALDLATLEVTDFMTLPDNPSPSNKVIHEGRIMDGALILPYWDPFGGFNQILYAFPVGAPSEYVRLNNSLSGGILDIDQVRIFLANFGGTPYVTDGTRQGTKRASWNQGIANHGFEFFLPHNNYVLSWLRGGLKLLHDDGKTVSVLDDYQDFSHSIKPYLSAQVNQEANGEKIIVSTSSDQGDPSGERTRLKINHLGRNPSQYYHLEMSFDGSSTEVFAGKASNYLAVTLLENDTVTIYRAPFTPFTDEDVIEVVGIQSVGQRVTLNLLPDASEIAWQLDHAEFVSYGDRSVTIDVHPKGFAYARVAYRDLLGNWQTASIRFERNCLENMHAWVGEGGPQITSMVADINNCQ